MLFRCVSSVLIVASLLGGICCSLALDPGSCQNRLDINESDMFDKIWGKYAQGGELMSLAQLNMLLRDTDHEFGDQQVSESWWLQLCNEMGADPSTGISKYQLLSYYFVTPPDSSIKRDYIRIFEDMPLAHQLSDEETRMFDEIWKKYSQGRTSMTMQQLNSLLHDTDHEFGDQQVSEAWWQQLCNEKGADPSTGISKYQLLSYYFVKPPDSSIKRDYIRIFTDGPLAKQLSDDESHMFDEIWENYSQGRTSMTMQQLNSLLHDTDHEFGDQQISQAWWQQLCKEKVADPSTGISKYQLLSYYFVKPPDSSIKRDYIRIFIDAPLAKQLSDDESRMFDEIWEKYSQGGTSMNMKQLNSLLHDTDHEFGDQQVSQAWWQQLCKEKGADPSTGISKYQLLSYYFVKPPDSSVKRDYIRIFKDGPLAKQLSDDESRMFDEIWEKYSQGRTSMNMQQLNSLLHDTDHEFGDQKVSEAWWQQLCKEKGADPNTGISKYQLLSYYFVKPPDSSIKRDYIRIFVDAPLAKQLSDEESHMFDEIWEKYSQGGTSMNMQQLNSLLYDTDHEPGDQQVSEAWWQQLCKEKGADPSTGISKYHLLSFYFVKPPDSSIKRDYIRIFVDAPLARQLSDEESRMFDEIWEKYSQGGTSVNMQQLNSLLHDTDHEFGDQQVSDAWWQRLCNEKGADPSTGISKYQLLSYYFVKPPDSSIKRDYIRIFVDAPLAKQLSDDESRMFGEIWEKYAQGATSMKMQQLNSLLHDTDHEFGDQRVSEAWWQQLCKEKGADPSTGISKYQLLSYYFVKPPDSSIQRDYIRIFVDAPLAEQLSDEESRTFDEIWKKYSQGGTSMNMQQLNSLLHDTDHEFGDQQVSDAWWQRLCNEKGADPSAGISKYQLLSYYFVKPPYSSIRRDYIRIFFDAPLAKQLSDDESRMFDKIWNEYAQDGTSMNMQQLNSLLNDTDHEFGEQQVSEAWWQKLCNEKAANPSTGISKYQLLSYYFMKPPDSSIKRDYTRIFMNAPPSKQPSDDESRIVVDVWKNHSQSVTSMNLEKGHSSTFSGTASASTAQPWLQDPQTLLALLAVVALLTAFTRVLSSVLHSIQCAPHGPGSLGHGKKD